MGFTNGFWLTGTRSPIGTKPSSIPLSKGTRSSPDSYRGVPTWVRSSGTLQPAIPSRSRKWLSTGLLMEGLSSSGCTLICGQCRNNSRRSGIDARARRLFRRQGAGRVDSRLVRVTHLATSSPEEEGG